MLIRGKNNLIENNIFVNTRGLYQISIDPGYSQCATIIRKNIICYSSGGTEMLAFYAFPAANRKAVLAESDYNLFYKPGSDDPVMTDGIRLSAWRKLYPPAQDAYDTHSLVADPLFVDAAKGDYRLKAESPAFKLGFKPTDISQIGPRREFKPK
jgi:hypothetical protein